MTFDPRTRVVETHINRLRSKTDKWLDVYLIRTRGGEGNAFGPVNWAGRRHCDLRSQYQPTLHRLGSRSAFLQMGSDIFERPDDITRESEAWTLVLDGVHGDSPDVILRRLDDLDDLSGASPHMGARGGGALERPDGFRQSEVWRV